MKQEKSQTLIEFALILPLFLLLVFGIFYIGSIFADYLTLSTIARNSAREASVVSWSDETDRKAKYETIRARYVKQPLPLDVYTWKPSPDKNDEPYNINYKDHNVVVKVKATINQNGIMFAKIISGLSGNEIELLNLSITYTMYSEDNKN